MRLTPTLLALTTLLSLSAPALADGPAPLAPIAYAPPQVVYVEPMPVPRVRRSTAAFVTGIILTSVGAAAAVIGTGALLSHDNGHESCVTANEAAVSAGLSPIDCTNHSSKAPAYALIIGGAAGAVVGIPLAIYGGQKIPVTTARLTFSPTSTGATAAMTFRF